MNIFGIGTGELLIIMVAALIIFGPGKLPEVAGQLGRAVRDFRRMTSDLTGEFEKTFAEVNDVKKAFTSEVSGVRSQVSSVSESVKKDLAKTSSSVSTAKGKSSSTTTTKTTTTTSTKPARASTTTGRATTTPKSTAKPVAAAPPVATKADPLAGVSMLEDEAPAARSVPPPFVEESSADPEYVEEPSEPTAAASGKPVSLNGSATAVPDALVRARQRRASAGYNRRAD